MNNNLAVSSSKEILETMDNCTKCGICHSFCPVANVTKEFPGPKFTGPQTQRFRMIESLEELSPDLCNGCGICTSVCPNGVAITDIITLAKSKGMKLVYTATKEKELHKRYVKFHNMILAETSVKTFLRDLDGNYSKDLHWISDDEQFKKQRKD